MDDRDDHWAHWAEYLIFDEGLWSEPLLEMTWLLDAWPGYSDVLYRERNRR